MPMPACATFHLAPAPVECVRGAIRRLFEKEMVVEGDLILIERFAEQKFSVSKASKRGFKYYL